MRPTAVYLNAAITGVGGGGGVNGGGVGFSKWVPHDIYQTPFNTTLALVFSNGSTVNATVQYTLDDIGPNARRAPVSISQTTTVITVTDLGDPNAQFPGGAQIAGHNLLIGDYVQLIETGIGIDGDYQVTTVPNATTYTLTSSISQSAVSPGGLIVAARVFNHAVLAAQTARNSSNYAFPVKASRLIDNSGVGTVGMLVWQGGLSS